MKVLSKAGDFVRLIPLMTRMSAGVVVHGIRRHYVRASLRKKTVNIDPTARIIGPELIDFSPYSSVGLFSRIAAVSTPECDVAPLLKVDERTWIGDNVNIHAQCGVITIGKGCLIANAVLITSCTHRVISDKHLMQDEPFIGQDVHIGDDVWIGAGVIVLPGSRIGDGAVVGAGAVVRGTVAPYDIVVGVPIKVIGSRKNRD
jgi:acetyltransferase-like isoleucine patch superfamily enzyme